MARKIDGKYHIEGDRLVVTKTGETVPEDEPLFLLRGKDGLAAGAITCYAMLCAAASCSPEQMQGVEQAMMKFGQFAALHPGRMKKPDA